MSVWQDLLHDRCIPILGNEAMRRADAACLEYENIRSLDLMERAAAACCAAIDALNLGHEFHLFCGPGNNGGDGLALARLLWERRQNVHVYLLTDAAHLSADGKSNLRRLEKAGVQAQILKENALPELGRGVIVDALFGSGMTRALEGLALNVVQHLNAAALPIVAIDLPSGLPFESPVNAFLPRVQADYILCLGAAKPSLLDLYREQDVPQCAVLDIGLLPVIDDTKAFITTEHWFYKNLRPRPRAAHKGCFGHGLLIVASYGMLGAGIFTAKAASCSGMGKMTLHVPQCAYEVMQAQVPEAMLSCDANAQHWSESPAHLSSYSVVAFGPGIGQNPATARAVIDLCKRLTPEQRVVIDADGLNILSQHREVLVQLPHKTVITPHIKEFSSLAQEDVSTLNFDMRVHLARQFSQNYNCILVLKDAYTLITDGQLVLINTCGTPGLAQGGSGDILTGIIAALLAQHYPPLEAAALAVYAHARAGERAAQRYSEMGMTPADTLTALKSIWQPPAKGIALNKCSISCNLSARHD